MASVIKQTVAYGILKRLLIKEKESMASIFEQLLGQLGGGAVDQISRQVGGQQNQVSSAVMSALPALLGALSKNASNEGGAGALLGALDRDHDGSVLDDLQGFLGSGRGTSDGQKILGHIFGGNQNRVERRISKQSGLSGQSTAQLLAMLAPVVMGALGKNRKEQNLDSRQLGRVLARERQQIERSQPGGLGILSGILDADGDGDVDASDVAKKGVGLLGRLFGRR